MSGLTKKQRKLVGELEAVYSLLHLDFYDIGLYPKKTEPDRKDQVGVGDGD
jgi:hypothetical protein